MKITFLGTSHGVPAKDRYCSCTMIESGNSIYLIDAGAPIIDILLRRGVPLSSIRAIFLTHTHGDHANGLVAFADLANWYFKDVDCDIYLTEQNAIDKIPDLVTALNGGDFDSDRLRFRFVDKDFVYSDENIRVKAMPTRHLEDAGRPAYSYLIEAEGKSAIFTGDMSPDLKYGDFPAYALENEVDLVVSEMAHFKLHHILPYLKKCKARRVLFNHVFPLDKIEYINALDGRLGYPIHAVNDGDEIEL